jgi:hypothetical protein
MGELHSILRVVTRDGQAFAVDVTAAQFGWTEIMVPWEVYFAQRVRSVHETMSFGTFADLDKGIAAKKDYVGGIQEARIKISKSLSGIVSEWLRKKTLTPTQLLDLSDDEYALQEESLMAAVRNGVKASVDALRHSGLYRCYTKGTPNVSNVGEMSLTRSRREYKEHKKSWVTEKEYEKRIIRICKSKGRTTGLAGVIKKW